MANDMAADVARRLARIGRAGYVCVARDGSVLAVVPEATVETILARPWRRSRFWAWLANAYAGHLVGALVVLGLGIALPTTLRMSLVAGCTLIVILLNRSLLKPTTSYVAFELQIAFISLKDKAFTLRKIPSAPQRSEGSE